MRPDFQSAPDAEGTVDAAYDEDQITEVIRPAAVIPEESASQILVELSLNSVTSSGRWRAEPSRWMRYDRPWRSPVDPGDAELIGSIQVAYGTPTRYEITIYRVTITRHGRSQGWTVEALTDEALGYGELSLAECPRVALVAPPKPFRF